MNLALLFLLVVGAQDGAGTVAASFRCDPEVVDVGEPFWLVLDLVHPADTSVFELGAAELELDDSWVVLEQRLDPPAPSAEAGRRLTRRRWWIASLEPGTRSLADVVSALVLDERVGTVDAASTTVQVTGVLGPDEDEPRPLRGFPEGFGQAPGATMTPLGRLVLALAVLFWTAVGWLVWRRWKRRRPKAVPSEDPLEELERLRGRAAGDARAATAQHYELTHILRRATDRRLGVRRDGLTDEEWLAIIQASGRVSAEAARDMAQVFERAEAVKYAGSAPSSWALDETFGQARRTLQNVVAGDVENGPDSKGGAA